MDFSLNEMQETLKKEAREFLKKECPESFVRDMEADHKGFSPELWRKMADLDWLGAIYPEQYGGMGISLMDLAVIYEEMGRAMLPSPHLSTVVLCGLTILEAGSDEQKADLLTKIAKGELILSLALTEPESSWDGRAWQAEGVSVRAVADGENYVINGTKLFVHDAHIADNLLCVARTADQGKPEEGITLFLVDAKDPGISYEILETTAGDKQCEVVFNNVKVPQTSIIGALNGGWPPLEKVLAKGAVLLCADMVGAGQRVLEITVDYAKARIQFDLPIGINQYVQDHCAYLLSEVDSSRWLTYQAAWKLTEGLPCDTEVAMAKAWTSDSHERACWRGHQVMAGTGYEVDNGLLPLYSRRGKTKQLYLGGSDHYLEKLMQHVEKWPEPEKFRGKALGIFDIPKEKQVPLWQPWRERWEEFEKGKLG
ncbi:acyl-CoA dehydrogenase family protein [Thermodesulfobacteriota bacterium]